MPDAVVPEGYCKEIHDIQQRLVDTGKVPTMDRALHQKQTWGGKARIEFSAALPAQLRADVLSDVAGHAFAAAVRFSNGLGCPYKDTDPDVRGIAVKLAIGPVELDLLAINGIPFARHTKQFMRFVHIFGLKQADGGLKAAGELVRKLAGGEYDALEAARIAGRLTEAARPIPHLALETYWTQPTHIGSTHGRFVFSPGSGATTQKGLLSELADGDYLRHNMETDLEKGPVRMKLGFEAFTDDAPLADASVHGAFVLHEVGELIIDQRPRTGREAEEALIGKMAFNAAHGLPMDGTMTDADRGEVYRESARNRAALPWDHPDIRAFFA